MKHLRFLVLLLCIGALTGIISCGGGDDDPAPSAEDVQLELIARSWTLSSATVDNTNVTSNFDGLVVTFTTDKGYSTNGDYAPVWPGTGTWDFGTSVNQIVRSDNVTIALSNLTATTATLTFSFTTLPGGRATGIVGNYEMAFTSN